MTEQRDWRLFQGTNQPCERLALLPDPPSWRPRRADTGTFSDRRRPRSSNEDDTWLRASTVSRGCKFEADPDVVNMVNAALYLRRPLLVTGQPGSGKSRLIDAVAYELRMGEPLRWSVGSRSTMREALYQYDAIGRLQSKTEEEGSDIGRFITLGPLGTALLPTKWPRALLIDEIDKGDIDLPNDLLNVFEEGEYDIPELKRLGGDQPISVQTVDPLQLQATVRAGKVSNYEFPLMILTSNGERDFPAPFLRRCLRLEMPNPTGRRDAKGQHDWALLDKVVARHFTPDEVLAASGVIAQFKQKVKDRQDLATDQLLNAITFVLHAGKLDGDASALVESLLTGLGTDAA
jgi:MoxR-like ATPase